MERFVIINDSIKEKMLTLKELSDVMQYNPNLSIQDAACVRLIERAFYTKEYAIGDRSLNVYIAGPTCSGKTTFAKKLEDYFRRKNISVATIHQDDYYKNLKQISRCSGGYYMDAIDSFCVDEMISDFGTLLETGTVKVPCYDVKYNKRVGKKDAVKKGKINIVEGLHVIEIFKYDLDGIYFYMGTPIEKCLERRIARDTKSIGVSKKRVIEYFDECIMPMYKKDILPQRYIEGLMRCYIHTS